MTQHVTPYQCFISYVRNDNTDFDGVVDRLRASLGARFEATTGIPLHIFLDRESIGWGERWREKIFDSIAGSTLFLPIITMRYFNSSMCRDEFLAFHAAAVQQGVRDLILPIVLAGADVILADSHSDELMQAVAALNVQRIDREWEAGYDSAAWKAKMGILVNGIRGALQRAGEQLSSAEDRTAATGADQSVLESVDEQILEDHLADVMQDLERITPIMEQLGNAATERLAGRDLGKMTTGQRAFLYGALAEDLATPANQFGSLASSAEAKASQLDAELRAVIAELKDIDLEAAKPPLEELRASMRDAFGGLDEVVARLTELEQSLRGAALGSVKLRRTLRPMSAGLRSISTVLELFRSWQTL